MSGFIWRLPNVKELQSIIETSCNVPAVNLDIFPSTDLVLYWSSTGYASSEEKAWGVSFSDGISLIFTKTFSLPVRLVRSK